jgi:hypothetical protein
LEDTELLAAAEDEIADTVHQTATADRTSGAGTTYKTPQYGGRRFVLVQS